MRDGQTTDIDVELLAAPDEPSRDAIVLGERSILPGLQLARINPAVISEMNLQLAASGVVVTFNGPYGAAAGLETGDVIETVRGKAVKTPLDVQKTLADGGRGVSMRVLRGEQRVQLRFRL